jgi:hypothetical protein
MDRRGHEEVFMTTHKGSCHCGKIAYEFEGGPITEGMECNCSMCGRKGTILHFVPAASFTLKTPRENLRTYLFNKHVIAHHFCPECGVSPFAEGSDSKGNTMAAINLRCVEGVDPRALKIHFHNGAAD